MALEGGRRRLRWRAHPKRNALSWGGDGEWPLPDARLQEYGATHIRGSRAEPPSELEALILCCGACWTGHMVRRWHADPFGFLRPWNEVPALMGSAPPATPPSTGTGVVTFLMG